MKSYETFSNQVKAHGKSVSSIIAAFKAYEASFFQSDYSQKRVLLTELLNAISDWIESFPEDERNNIEETMFDKIDPNAALVYELQGNVARLFYLPDVSSERFKSDDNLSFIENLNSYIRKARWQLIQKMMVSKPKTRMLAEEYGTEFRFDGQATLNFYLDNKNAFLSFREIQKQTSNPIYLNKEELSARKVLINEEGLFLTKESDTSDFKPLTTYNPAFAYELLEDHFLFVMDIEGNIYTNNQNDINSYKSLHHSSFLRGRPVVCAGSIKVKDGKLLEITTASGHYTPTMMNLYHVLDQLRKLNVDISAVRILSGRDQTVYDVNKILKTKGLCLPNNPGEYFFNVSQKGLASLDMLRYEAGCKYHLTNLEIAADLNYPEALKEVVLSLLAGYYVPVLRYILSNTSEMQIYYLDPNEKKSILIEQQKKALNYIKKIIDLNSADLLNQILLDIDDSIRRRSPPGFSSTMNFEDVEEILHIAKLIISRQLNLEPAFDVDFNQEYTLNLASELDPGLEFTRVESLLEILLNDSNINLSSRERKENLLYLLKFSPEQWRISFIQSFGLHSIYEAKNLTNEDKCEVLDFFINPGAQESSNLREPILAQMGSRAQPIRFSNGSKESSDPENITKITAGKVF